MGKHRNMRSRGEATFLEVVKMQMQCMQEDIAIIKSALLYNLASPDKDIVPPVPPPPYSYDRTTLLSCRSISSDHCNILPTVASIEDAQISTFLRSEGHFDTSIDLSRFHDQAEGIPLMDRIEIAQKAAKFRSDQDVDESFAQQTLKLQGGRSAISASRFPRAFLLDKQQTEKTDDEAKNCDLQDRNFNQPDDPLVSSSESQRFSALMNPFVQFSLGNFRQDLDRTQYLIRKIENLAEREGFSKDIVDAAIDQMLEVTRVTVEQLQQHLEQQHHYTCSGCAYRTTSQADMCMVCGGVDIFDARDYMDAGDEGFICSRCDTTYEEYVKSCLNCGCEDTLVALDDISDYDESDISSL